MATQGAGVNSDGPNNQGTDSRSEAFISRLSSEQPLDERRQAAGELEMLGMRTRSSLGKRGSSIHAASPEADDLLDALRLGLHDTDADVRLRIARATGDLADESLVADLADVMMGDPVEPVRLAAINAAGDIGGIGVIESFVNLLSGDESEEVRFAALAELDELIAEPITSGPDRRFDPALPVIRGSEQETDEEVTRRLGTYLVSLLRGMVEDERESSLMRLKADDLLNYLAQPAPPEAS